MQAQEQMDAFLLIANSVLHIYESLLSQEELPDFYEENLPAICEACSFIITVDLGALKTDSILKAQAKVIRLVHLYQTKFAEFFKQEYMDHFF